MPAQAQARSAREMSSPSPPESRWPRLARNGRLGKGLSKHCFNLVRHELFSNAAHLMNGAAFKGGTKPTGGRDALGLNAEFVALPDMHIAARCGNGAVRPRSRRPQHAPDWTRTYLQHGTAGRTLRHGLRW